MFAAINILTKTKNGDTYDEVAINKYPMVVFDNDISNISDIITDDTFVNGLKSHIKNEITFDNAKLYIRIFDDSKSMQDMLVQEYNITLKEIITKEQWKI